MRALVVVIVDPRANFRSCVVEPEEQRLVEQLVPHAAVEALAEAVLHRLARHDESIRPAAAALRISASDKTL